MNHSSLNLLRGVLAFGLVSNFSFNFSLQAAGDCQEARGPQPVAIAYFDVPDLPARVDEPKLRQSDQGFVLDCAVANRSSEQLLGLRLILLVVENSGKLRSRITWTETSELPSYSIKAFAFHPIIKGELRGTDQLYLGIDEVIGHETIWRAVGAEKALRAYSRGQPEVMPEVRTVANKFDPRTNAIVLPIRRY
ncbi:MAG: hypothetical protein AUJ04_01500 [Acidobacteria bacterium 13_1_40CM_3_55_6]|nr:MAG: hypothetical protein AUJ04_01500 [Acidobacteria bacterium 13_1_40CM_3_55_6]